MHPRPRSWPALDICWKCQWRLTPQHYRLGQSPVARYAITSAAGRRALHSSQLRFQSAVTISNTDTAFDPTALQMTPPIRIRKRLEQFQQELGGPDQETLKAFGNYPKDDGETINDVSVLNYCSKADEENREHQVEGEDDFDGDDLITIGLFLKPGDVVELSQPNREPVLGVFVQQLGMDSQFYSSNGRWCHSRLVDVSFAIPKAIDPMLVQPLVPYMPTDILTASSKGEVQVPRDIGAPVMQILAHIGEEAERIYRKNAPVLDTAYSLLADKSRTRMMNLKQISKALLGTHDQSWSPSPAALLAVRKSLHHNQFHFGSDKRSQRLTNVFAIRPTDDVAVIETVQDWIREYDEVQAAAISNHSHSLDKSTTGTRNVTQFLVKARRLIAISRRYRDPTFNVVGPLKSPKHAPDQAAPPRVTYGETFSSSDKQIITFLHAWVLQNQFGKMSSLHACCISLLRATGCYQGKTIRLPQDETAERISTMTGHLFLQEIGVLTPYEDRTIYDEQLMLPSVRLSRNLELLITKAELVRKSPDFHDSMAFLRHDWGSMTVYCIDDVGAKEIDDGVSIAKVPGKPDEYWVHVHVANPTAFFGKSHVLSGLAAHMTESVYTPQRAFPMLPKWASQNYFSLDRNRPVLTFSSRIDLAGNMLETKVQSGIIRNIVSITPSEVSEYLGEGNQVANETTMLVVGGEVPSPTAPRKRPELSPGDIQGLRDLYTAARVMWNRRKAAGGLKAFYGNASTVQVFENDGQAGLAWTPPSIDRFRLIQADPIIQFQGRSAKYMTEQEIDSSNITEELMLFAGQSAAAWCAERNIPAMYRGSVETPGVDDLTLEELQKQVVFPYLQKHGALSWTLGSRYSMALGKGIAHSSPLPHKIIGAKSYLKVTSPLRRFSDMIAHWQIEAALKYEARTKQKLNADIVSEILPFSKEQMQESIIALSPREKIISKTKADSVKFWTAQALMRAFYFKEAHLPDTMTVWIRDLKPESPTIPGLLSEYSIPIAMTRPEDGSEVKRGDKWEAKIGSIDVFYRIITMRPIRLLEREEE
ncbi:RNB-domain-containing protein [Pleomassaria siparia CBS 279.74]|uniref:RNB-domain-containing protein n=1 Tax=Pleomassaria siparia CBS 279.74 TaxID=1314801 RepID=A0A6G1K5V2_9PLEO|nr:RNB-domain-containing protein [Pleomassaria siparia CBS 279.74]